MKWICFLLLLGVIVACAGCISSPPPVTTPVSPATTSPITSTTTPAVPSMPNLVGNWTGTSTGYMQTSGYQVVNGGMTMKVVEQQDRLFKGQVAYVMNGSVVTKEFAGVFGRDGKTIETVEYPDGFSDGVVISSDEIELIFRDNANPSRIAIDTFKRSK